MKTTICPICKRVMSYYHPKTKSKRRKFCSCKCAGENLRRVHKPPRGKKWCSGHQAYLPIRKFPPTATRRQCSECSGAYDKERYTKLKKLAVEFLGGKCSKCGYNKYYGALDIHHPGKKSDNWGKLRKRTWEHIRAVLIKDKCVLLCSNCHREHHFTT